jgi:uncharacterized protein YkwD
MRLPPVPLTLFALGLTIGTIASDLARGDPFAVDSDRVSASILKETNAYRQKMGVPPLTLEPAIARVAQEYAQFLARTNKSGHTADNRDPGQRLNNRGITHCGVWENFFEYWSAPTIAPWETVAAQAMQDWKQSPGHRRNLLRDQAAHLGVGVAGWTHEGKHYYKIVQIFVDPCPPTQ